MSITNTVTIPLNGSYYTTGGVISTTIGSCAPSVLSIMGGTSTANYVAYGTNGIKSLPSDEISLLGETFTVYKNSDFLQILAQIDFLGIGYYESIKKMKLEDKLPTDIKDFLEIELKAFKRTQKIKKAIGTND